jgi:hypothetical protein
MPADLRDPCGEGMFPFRYDQRYDEAPNQFEPGASDIDSYLQSIAFETSGQKLNLEKLNDLKKSLEGKGLFHRNIGDEAFRAEAGRWIKCYMMARKVAENAPRSK